VKRTDYAARALQAMADRASGLDAIRPINWAEEARRKARTPLAAEAAAIPAGEYEGPVWVVDSREQIPWWLAAPDMYPHCELGSLTTGDYSLEGHEDHGIAVERKSLADLFGSCGGGRDRFEAEWERMSHFDYAAIVVEATLSDVLRGCDRSQMRPKAVVATLQAWSCRYGVHVHLVGPRALAEAWAYRLMGRWWGEQRREIFGGKT